jgi:uncharacterized protein (DUF4415 family)
MSKEKDLVNHTVDLTNLAPVMARRKAELAALAVIPENEIDTTDIAPLNEAFWKNAVQNPFFRPRKTSTTVRIDSDVLMWLRAGGPGYQSRINAILRRAMLSGLKSKA